MEKQGVTGIVLAGGKSSRMGTDKSLMLLHGRPIISYVIDAIKPLCDQVVISSNKLVYDFTQCEVWPDVYPIQAPMVGIYSCLKRSSTDLNIVVSCDVPFVESSLFSHLLSSIGHCDIAVPVHNNHLEPLCAVYRRTLVPAFQEWIDNENYRLFEFIDQASSYRFGISNTNYSTDIFLNINTLEEFNRASRNL